jgi:uncharacterized membrane protein YfcA
VRREWVTDIIAILIGVMWATSVFFTYLDHDYRPPPTVHLVMMAMVGAIFGSKVFNKLEKKKDESDRDPGAPG